jgi:hypothetical protein
MLTVEMRCEPTAPGATEKYRRSQITLVLAFCSACILLALFPSGALSHLEQQNNHESFAETKPACHMQDLESDVFSHTERDRSTYCSLKFVERLVALSYLAEAPRRVTWNHMLMRVGR